MPGWHAYIGGVEQTDVLFNSATLGAPFLSLFSRELPGSTLQGNYTAVLGPSAMTSVSLSQTGIVPGDAESLRFLVRVSSGPEPMSLDSIFGVFMNSQRLPLVALSNGPAYSILGADISGFAGHDATLTFSSFAVGQPNGSLLDSIAFSAMAVPQSSMLSLVALTAVLGWRGRLRRRRDNG